ncbi:MAG: hypothetical protein OXH89_06750 [bacterium]|nr:hypothetical protein [bacterium]
MTTGSTDTGSAGIVAGGSTGSIEGDFVGGSAGISASVAAGAGGVAVASAARADVSGTVVASGGLLVEVEETLPGPVSVQAPRSKHPSRASARSVKEDPAPVRQGGPDP